MRDPEVMAAAEAGPLGDLPVPVVERLLGQATLIRASAGTTLYHPGDPVGMHLVVAGVVQVAMTSLEGRQLRIRNARRGEVLAAPIVVSGSVPVTAHAVTAVAVARTPPDLLPALARNDSRVALWLAEELSRRVHGLLAELARNTFFPVKARVARHLLDLATGTQRGTELQARVSQQELADAVGTVREVVARTLAGFRSDGLVDSERDRIHITDAHGLAGVATISPDAWLKPGRRGRPPYPGDGHHRRWSGGPSTATAGGRSRARTGTRGPRPSPPPALRRGHGCRGSVPIDRPVYLVWTTNWLMPSRRLQQAFPNCGPRIFPAVRDAGGGHGGACTRRAGVAIDVGSLRPISGRRGCTSGRRPRRVQERLGVASRRGGPLCWMRSQTWTALSCALRPMLASDCGDDLLTSKVPSPFPLRLRSSGDVVAWIT